MLFLHPLQTRFQGYIGSTLSVRLSLQNSSPVHIFLMEKHWKFLLHTKIAYDLRVCHDLDPRSFGQGQGHWQKKCKERHWKFLLSTKIAYDLGVCHDLDPMSFWQVKVTGRKKCKIRVHIFLMKRH